MFWHKHKKTSLHDETKNNTPLICIGGHQRQPLVKHTHKVNEQYMDTYLNWKHVVRCGSKNEHEIDTCLDHIGLHPTYSFVS